MRPLHARGCVAIIRNKLASEQRQNQVAGKIHLHSDLLLNMFNKQQQEPISLTHPYKYFQKIRCDRCAARRSMNSAIRSLFFTLTLLLLASCEQTTSPEEKSKQQFLWTFLAGAGIYYSSPALSPDEQAVYIGTSTGILGTAAANNALYAISAATGAKLWVYSLGAGEVRSSPAVSPNGSILFVASERNSADPSRSRDLLFCLSASGQMQWTFDINPTPVMAVDVGQSAPSIAADGTIYVAAGGLYAINADGSLKWRRFYPAAEDIRNAPAVGPDGTLYFVYHNIPLTALDPDDGRTLWSCSLGVNDHVFTSPAISGDGKIIVATNPGVVYAVSKSGEIAWTFDTASIGYSCNLRSSPAIDADGTIYFGTNFGQPASMLIALTASGALKWTFTPASLPTDVPSDHFDIYSSPAIGTDGLLYFGQEFGRVYALQAETGTLQWFRETSSGITWSSPALSSAGTLFIGDLSGRLYAFKTTSRGLSPAAFWPRFKHDNRNSGCKAL